MLDKAFDQAPTAELRPNVHPLQLAVLFADELDAAAAGRLSIAKDGEEGDLPHEELLDGVAMAAFDGIERADVLLKLGDELGCRVRVRPFFGY